MNKVYRVNIRETFSSIVTVEASSRTMAEFIAERRWNDGEYISAGKTSAGVDFAASEQQKPESKE